VTASPAAGGGGDKHGVILPPPRLLKQRLRLTGVGCVAVARCVSQSPTAESGARYAGCRRRLCRAANAAGQQRGYCIYRPPSALKRPITSLAVRSQ